MEPYDWTDLLTNEFPNLHTERFQTVAEPTDRYNCMGHAADDTSRWWWPDGTNYWPPWATQLDRIKNFHYILRSGTVINSRSTCPEANPP